MHSVNRFCGAGILIFEIEVLYGARYRDAPPGSCYRSAYITWADIGSIRIHPLRFVYRKLHTMIYSQKFDPESGTYASVWSPKNLFGRFTSRLRGKSTTEGA